MREGKEWGNFGAEEVHLVSVLRRFISVSHLRCRFGVLGDGPLDDVSLAQDALAVVLTPEADAVTAAVLVEALKLQDVKPPLSEMTPGRAAVLEALHWEGP